MKRYVSIIVVVLLPILALADSKAQSMVWNHEVRVGWGDQLFETLAWHKPTAIITSMPEDFRKAYKEDFHYDQHVWAEYQYSFSHWFSLGLKFDMSHVRWSEVVRNGRGEQVSRDPHHDFYNVEIMPTMRFTYFRLDWVSLYLGLGAGLGINGGTEEDALGRKTLCGMALDVTLLGAAFNYKRAFVAFDYGGVYSLHDTNTIFLLKSRMFSVSVGCRF